MAALALACLLCTRALFAWGAAPLEACTSAEEGCESVDTPSLLQTSLRDAPLAQLEAREATSDSIELPPLEVPPPPPRPPVAGAYTKVSFPTSTNLNVADYIMQNMQGVAHAKLVMPGEPGYQEAFFPKVPGTAFYNEHSYPGLWGDKGSTDQPGFGGIKTYNVVNITPSAEGLKLYRVSAAEHPATYRCGIWWGSESTFATSIVNASTNVQVCSVPGAFNRCTVTEPITAIVGQGWPIDETAAVETRGCIDSEGSPTSKGGFVTEFYLNKTPSFNNPPPSTVLQIILPACQLVDAMSSPLAQCVSLDLPTNVEELQSLSDLTALFDTEQSSNLQPIAKLGERIAEVGRPPFMSFDWDLDHR